MLRITLAALTALGVAPLGSARPQAGAPSPAPPPAALFDAADPLAITLTADFNAIAKERGEQKHPHPGVLSYVTPRGDSVSLKVNLHTRGHYRLRICSFPPLKVEFDKNESAHTLFAHQGNLKLVVQCRDNRASANYLIEEYLIYRVFNLVTQMSFKARLARVTYVDATARRPPETRYGFFLENDDRMARRNHAQVEALKGVIQSQTDPAQMGLVTVFEYLIANTDFSVAGLHNIVLIKDSAHVYFAVPYDFDWSGVISPPYAIPDSRLGLRTVRDRLYRGYCRTPEELAPYLAAFNAVKDSIYALYRGQEGLEQGRVEEALKYYDEFYRTINDPRRVKRAFIDS
ncbi:MAG: hypothetical protein DMD41_14045, partial [Gemmatimonadetes bacterium]